MNKLTEEQILDIQTSDESAKVCAKRLGITHQKVNALRRFSNDGPKPEKNPPKRVKVCDGPTTGYRDADGGKVERRDFADGWLPGGWHDTPAKCENCDGKSHPEYLEAE